MLETLLTGDWLGTEELYIIAIVILMPLTACLLVLQVNPYHALVIRGILGAIAALIYALFGAADVALTEALVGTMLSITLYAVAVRSSLSLRLGMLDDQAAAIAHAATSAHAHAATPLLTAMRKMLSKYHMRLEPVSYPNLQVMQTALMAKEIHATCVFVSPDAVEGPHHGSAPAQPSCRIQTRVRRLYEMMQSALPSTVDIAFTEVNPVQFTSSKISPPEIEITNSVGGQS